MFVVLALLSSMVLGSADFVGGLAARRIAAAVVVVWSNAAGLAMALVLTITVLPGRAEAADLAWGGLAGLCGSAGAVLLYRALARGTMSLVAPTSAAAAAAIPVAAGLALGERLTGVASCGIVVALVSIVLISRTSTTAGGSRRHQGLVCAVLSGVSFGVFLVLLARTDASSGLWPLVSARCVSVTLLVGFALLRRGSVRTPWPVLRFCLLAGGLDMAANVLYLVAVRGASLAVIGLLASLSPLGTVMLARLLLKERMRLTQGVGVGLAISSVMLLAVRG